MSISLSGVCFAFSEKTLKTGCISVLCARLLRVYLVDNWQFLYITRKGIYISSCLIVVNDSARFWVLSLYSESVSLVFSTHTATLMLWYGILWTNFLDNLIMTTLLHGPKRKEAPINPFNFINHYVFQIRCNVLATSTYIKKKEILKWTKSSQKNKMRRKEIHLQTL